MNSTKLSLSVLRAKFVHGYHVQLWLLLTKMCSSLILLVSQSLQPLDCFAELPSICCYLFLFPLFIFFSLWNPHSWMPECSIPGVVLPELFREGLIPPQHHCAFCLHVHKSYHHAVMFQTCANLLATVSSRLFSLHSLSNSILSKILQLFYF